MSVRPFFTLLAVATSGVILGGCDPQPGPTESSNSASARVLASVSGVDVDNDYVIQVSGADCYHGWIRLTSANLGVCAAGATDGCGVLTSVPLDAASHAFQLNPATVAGNCSAATHVHTVTHSTPSSSGPEEIVFEIDCVAAGP